MGQVNSNASPGLFTCHDGESVTIGYEENWLRRSKMLLILLLDQRAMVHERGHYLLHGAIGKGRSCHGRRALGKSIVARLGAIGARDGVVDVGTVGAVRDLGLEVLARVGHESVVDIFLSHGDKSGPKA